jgi:hypothetical protein
MARGDHELPKVLSGPAMPDPSTLCRWATPETALWPPLDTSFRQPTPYASGRSIRMQRWLLHHRRRNAAATDAALLLLLPLLLILLLLPPRAAATVTAAAADQTSSWTPGRKTRGCLLF